MEFRVYFLLFPQAFNRHLRRHIDNKSSMDLRVYFISFPFNKYSKNIPQPPRASQDLPKFPEESPIHENQFCCVKPIISSSGS